MNKYEMLLEGNRHYACPQKACDIVEYITKQCHQNYHRKKSNSKHLTETSKLDTDYKGRPPKKGDI